MITLPDYTVHFGSLPLRIVRLPLRPPEVRGHLDQPRYNEGEELKMECISRGARPEPNITWQINGEKVPTDISIHISGRARNNFFRRFFFFQIYSLPSTTPTSVAVYGRALRPHAPTDSPKPVPSACPFSSTISPLCVRTVPISR